jgi:hypothetical protein
VLTPLNIVSGDEASLFERAPAIHGERLTGNEVGVGRSEEGDHRRPVKPGLRSGAFAQTHGTAIPGGALGGVEDADHHQVVVELSEVVVPQHDFATRDGGEMGERLIEGRRPRRQADDLLLAGVDDSGLQGRAVGRDDLAGLAVDLHVFTAHRPVP